jgi:hypothetical protein
MSLRSVTDPNDIGVVWKTVFDGYDTVILGRPSIFVR